MKRGLFMGIIAITGLAAWGLLEAAHDAGAVLWLLLGFVLGEVVSYLDRRIVPYLKGVATDSPAPPQREKENRR